MILEQQELMKIFKVYRLILKHSRNDLINSYFEGNNAQITSLISTSLSELNDENILSEDFKEAVQQYLDTVSAIFIINDRNECRLQYEDQNSECVMPVEDAEAWREAYTGIETSYESISDLITMDLTAFTDVLAYMLELEYE